MGDTDFMTDSQFDAEVADVQRRIVAKLRAQPKLAPAPSPREVRESWLLGPALQVQVRAMQLCVMGLGAAGAVGLLFGVVVYLGTQAVQR